MLLYICTLKENGNQGDAAISFHSREIWKLFMICAVIYHHQARMWRSKSHIARPDKYYQRKTFKKYWKIYQYKKIWFKTGMKMETLIRDFMKYKTGLYTLKGRAKLAIKLIQDCRSNFAIYQSISGNHWQSFNKLNMFTNASYNPEDLHWQHFLLMQSRFSDKWND